MFELQALRSVLAESLLPSRPLACSQTQDCNAAAQLFWIRPTHPVAALHPVAFQNPWLL